MNIPFTPPDAPEPPSEHFACRGCGKNTMQFEDGGWEHEANCLAKRAEQADATYHAQLDACQRAKERLESKLGACELERDKAQQACAVAYQILGSLSCDFDCFEHPLIQDALTMLADYEETKELLPWDSRSPEEWRSQAATARAEYQCDRNTACIIRRGHEGDCETTI